MSRQASFGAHWRDDRAALRLATQASLSWTSMYTRVARLVDCACALSAGLLAFEIRFDGLGRGPVPYLALSLGLPLLWLPSMALAGGYDSRFIGVGSDEFRKVVNVGVCLIAAVAMLAYGTKADLARGYVVIALPSATLFDLFGRYALRKRLHKLRSRGRCLRRVVVVGHAPVVADLTAELQRETYHGLSVVAALLSAAPVSWFARANYRHGIRSAPLPHTPQHRLDGIGVPAAREAATPRRRSSTGSAGRARTTSSPHSAGRAGRIRPTIGPICR